jgi:hypothetical protein
MSVIDFEFQRLRVIFRNPMMFQNLKFTNKIKLQHVVLTRASNFCRIWEKIRAFYSAARVSKFRENLIISVDFSPKNHTIGMPNSAWFQI